MLLVVAIAKIVAVAGHLEVPAERLIGRLGTAVGRPDEIGRALCLAIADEAG